MSHKNSCQRSAYIASLIRQTGLSNRKFSKVAGIPPSTLNTILERGVGRASYSNVQYICEALGITIDELEKSIREDSEIPTEERAFARNLSGLRKKEGITMEELATIINLTFGCSLTKGMISKWENNISVPSISYLGHLAIFFHVTVGYLIGLSDESEEEWSLEEREAIEKYKKFIIWSRNM